MTTISRIFGRRLGVAAAIVLAVTAALAWGEDVELEENEDDVVVENGFAFGDENFDMWLFGNNAARGGRGRDTIAAQLSLQIHEIDRRCTLTEAQKTKLLLAGQGDIKRFYDRVAEAKKTFDRLKNDRNKIGEVFQEIQPLQARINAGIFGDGAFFAKCVAKTLTTAQVDEYTRATRERRAYRYRAKVELTVAMLDDAVGLTADQRARLVDLIVDQTTPPRIFGQNDTHYVIYQVSLLPEDKLKAILDAAQWRAARRLVQNARGMEAVFRNLGMLDEPVAAVLDAAQPREAAPPVRRGMSGK
jgi:hypothetical protein